MYSNGKIRGNRRVSGFGRRNGGNGGGRSGGRSSYINPNVYVNKATEAVAEEAFQPIHSFSDFALNPAILERVIRRGYVQPTPIQDQAIPAALEGRDVIGIAETGTGKTAAFLLPILTKMSASRGERALIIVPTRELAVQIEEELRAFAAGLPIYSALCIGGGSMFTQLRALERRPQFIIGTPGRLKDHINRGSLRLNDVRNLVVDEADRLVEMGFITDTRLLISYLPKDRQSFFFSATIGPEIRHLIDAFMNNPETISVKKRDTSANIDQDVVRYTDPFHKLTLLHEMLIREEFKKVLIFGRTKHGVQKLADILSERGFSAVAIHGNKNQGQRQRALQEFKQDRAQIMVATDVAARGLDIPDVTHVINYEAPENYSDYIHRIGRTGRANKKGSALTFVK
ncbi:MAG TPA: DEAD/DEAH box helicase [Candidatus Saccharimonadales bacterium]|nr:DEAD/DEAH box helicase [Candidatus Saccharimonadales bacterium]